MNLSVVAPSMNEEEGLEAFYLSLRNVIKMTGLLDYEIIFIDDGSTDGTWNIICDLHHRDHKVKGIKLSRNFGHQAALTAGLSIARGDSIFIIDSDLQDPPELLIPMLKKMKEGFDVVYGKRKKRSGETVFKLFTASAFYHVLSLLADVEIPKDTGDFRLMNKRVLEAYLRINESQRFTRGLIAWLGFKQTAISYNRNARYAGTTKYPLKKMINFSLDAVTGFSLKPLRIIIYLGLVTSFLSICAFLYSFYGWYLSQTVPGWASIMTAVCILSSAQLICIGVVGEYVGRTFFESKKRPLYLIEDTTGESEEKLHGPSHLKQNFEISDWVQ